MSSPDEYETSDLNDDVVDDEHLSHKIAVFVLCHSLSVVATAELLKLFKSAGVRGLPKDRRTLLKSERIKDVVEKCGGTFKYFGFCTTLATFLDNNPDFIANNNILTFSAGLDGVPLYKSCSGQFWPVICQIKEMNRSGSPFCTD